MLRTEAATGPALQAGFPERECVADHITGAPTRKPPGFFFESVRPRPRRGEDWEKNDESPP